MLRNCKIINTLLGPAAAIDGHSCFSFRLELDFGDQRVLFGFVSLDEEGSGGRMPTAYGMEVIMQLLKVAEVPAWEDLKGKAVRADIDETSGQVVGLFHLLNDGLAIHPTNLFQQKYAPVNIPLDTSSTLENEESVQEILDQAQRPEF